MWYSTSSGRIELSMTLAQARSVSHPGECLPDVQALMTAPAIRRQLAKIDPALLAEELKEWGAWEPEELADHQANLQRLVWLTGCDIAET